MTPLAEFVIGLFILAAHQPPDQLGVRRSGREDPAGDYGCQQFPLVELFSPEYLERLNPRRRPLRLTNVNKQQNG